VEAVAFGDLYLEEIRAYREKQCAAAGIAPLFPIWGEPTAALARHIVDEGFRATLCCVDPRRLAPEFAGRAFDHALLDALPEGVDPCGENGEFHTFVHAAPNMQAPVPVRPGEVVERDGFVFADLLPGRERAAGRPARRGAAR
jgi:diphthamide synthase (EF-2-diphthine--ammonia ligase)